MALPKIDILSIVNPIGGFFKKVFTSKWLYVVLLMIAIGGGIYLTLNHWKDQAVSTAVTTENTKASNTALEAKDRINTRTGAVDVQMDKLRDQTTKDFTNARATLQAQPQADRDAPAPRVIIDTINDLDRLRSTRDAPATDHADVPVG